MAKTTVVNTDDSNTYELGNSNHTWIFGESHVFSGEDNSIHQAANLTNDTIIINGRVNSGAAAGAGVLFEGGDSKITVGEGGSVTGDTGISATGANALVTNNGIVTANGFASAISMGGANAHAVNNGELFGLVGIDMNSKDGVIDNNGSIRALFSGIFLDIGGETVNLGKTSVIAADNEGINLTSSTGEKTKITNDGLIAMNDATAVGATDGDEVVINHGTIRGDIMLGAGKDVFNNLDGKYSGDIFGGAGNDLFIVNSAKTQINELSGEGTDTVRSTVSFSFNTNALMNSELENLTLLGTKNLHGTGNSQQNIIKGNSGGNVLSGEGQNDILTGGKGHDTFVFATNFDADEVKDFHKGVDKVDLSGMVDIADFKDMMKNHVSEVAGNVHITSGADDLVLDHVSKADLHATDFIF